MSAAVFLLLFAAPPLRAPDAGTLSLDAQLRLTPDAGPLPLSMPPRPFVWELPQTTMHDVPIDGTTYVRGVPVRMRYVMVKDTPVNIGRHFLESFKRQGMYLAEGQQLDRAVTGVDPSSLQTYTVILQPNQPGYTTVILGEAKPLEKKPLAVGGLPMPPSVRDAVPVKFEGYLLLSFSAAEPIAEVQSFYAVELPRAGYEPVGEGEWAKPGERLEVTLSVDGKRTRVLLKQHKAP